MMYRNSWFLEGRATSLDMTEAFRPRRHLRVEAFTESALIMSRRPQSLRSLSHGNWWPMFCRRRLLDRSGTVLSCQCFPTRSLLLSSRLRISEVYFLWRGSCSTETFRCTLIQRVLLMEHLCSTPSSVHEKVGCGLGPFHRTLSISSRPSSAHLSAFSLRNSPPWALILMNMVKRPILTLWWRTLMMRANISPSGKCRRRGSLPSPTQFEATVMSPLESVRTTIGWSWVRESSRARHAAANSRSEERRVGKECRSRWSPYH